MQRAIYTLLVLVLFTIGCKTQKTEPVQYAKMLSHIIQKSTNYYSPSNESKFSVKSTVFPGFCLLFPLDLCERVLNSTDFAQLKLL